MTPEQPLLRFTSHYDGNENRTMMTPSERGDWVHFCDVEPLVKALREAREALDEREGDMHARIRAGYDKTVADMWRAHCAKIEKERDEARAEIERMREAVRQVHALAGAAVRGTAVGAWLQTQEIHKITKGTVE